MRAIKLRLNLADILFVLSAVFVLADKIVFQTPGAKSYFPRSVQKKGVIIPNPISDRLPDAYHGERDRRVVNFCRIAPQKNLKVLLDAFDFFFREYPDYTLDIYGIVSDGAPYKAELEAYAKTLSAAESIRFYPGCADVHQKIIQANMFVSSSDYEGIFNSMLEAMAIGLPVIVTDCANGGERMCIQDGKNGLIVPRRDAKAMAEAMILVAENEDFAYSVSTEAAKIRNRFSQDEIFCKWKEVIKQMCLEGGMKS